MSIREDAREILEKSIRAVLPHEAVKTALLTKKLSGKVYLIAIGKAAFSMAKAAKEALNSQIVDGIVITKYGHSQGSIDGVEIIEAGHPVLDENAIKGTEKVLELVKNLTAEDTILFLVSGGGSALFEKPLSGVLLKDLENITSQLLASGADIIEINTIRKHLSAVKGGRFALSARPAQIFSIVLSDVVGDRLDTIASGPAYPDHSTVLDALEIIEKYNLKIEPYILERIKTETPKELDNIETVITGSVRVLCEQAAEAAQCLGYKPLILTTNLTSEAKEGGRFLAAIARDIKLRGNIQTPCAVIVGGETVVTLKGTGKGGRNQEFALAAAEGIAGLSDVVIASVGSDGTDGPTDAAGGIVDGKTKEILAAKDLKIDTVLANNDAYNGLLASDGLIITGPTGTNVNDVAILLCK
jgi:hydroxypyruvate reductase